MFKVESVCNIYFNKFYINRISHSVSTSFVFCYSHCVCAVIKEKVIKVVQRKSSVSSEPLKIFLLALAYNDPWPVFKDIDRTVLSLFFGGFISVEIKKNRWAFPQIF